MKRNNKKEDYRETNAERQIRGGWRSGCERGRRRSPAESKGSERGTLRPDQTRPRFVNESTALVDSERNEETNKNKDSKFNMRANDGPRAAIRPVRILAATQFLSFCSSTAGSLSYFGKKRVRKMGRSGQPFDLSPAEDVFHLLRTESKAGSHKGAAAEAGLAEHLQGGKAAFGDFLKGFLL